MKMRIAAVSVAAMSLCACATVTRGTNTAWEVNTSPLGAKVETSHGHQCPSTPCAMKMPRKSQFTATITKAGYKPVQVSVTTKVSGGGGAAMAGNVILGGLIGAGVDASSGAMLDLVPNPVSLTLEPEDAQKTEAPKIETPKTEASASSQVSSAVEK